NKRQLQLLFSGVLIVASLYMAISSVKALHFTLPDVEVIITSATAAFTIAAAVIILLLIYRLHPVQGVDVISVGQLKQKIFSGSGDTQFIDVREADELLNGTIPGFANIPLSELESRLSEIRKDREVVLICRSGRRSLHVAKLLKKRGYENVT